MIKIELSSSTGALVRYDIHVYGVILARGRRKDSVFRILTLVAMGSPSKCIALHYVPNWTGREGIIRIVSLRLMLKTLETEIEK